MFAGRSIGLRAWLVILVVLAVLPGFAVVAATAWLDRRGELGAAQQELATVATLAAREVMSLHRGTLRLLQAVGSVPSVQEPGLDDLCAAFVARVRHRMGAHTRLSVHDVQGRARCDPDTAHDAPAAPGVAHRRALSTGRFAIGEHVRPAGTQRPTLDYALPFTDAGGTIAGVLHAGVDLHAANEGLSSAFPDSRVRVHVIDHRGVVLLQFPYVAAALGAPLSHLSLATHAQQVVPGRQVPVRGVEFIDDRRAGRLAALALASDPDQAPVRVVASMDRDQVFAAADRRLLGQLLALLAVAMLGGIAAFVFGHRAMLVPMARLMQRARGHEEGAGVQTQPPTPGRVAEFAELERSLDRLARVLSEREDVQRRAAQPLQAQLDRAGRINRVARAIIDRIDLDGLCRLVADEVLAGTSAHLCVLARTDPVKGRLIVSCAASRDPRISQRVGLQKDDTLPIDDTDLAQALSGRDVDLPGRGTAGGLALRLRAAGLPGIALHALHGGGWPIGLMIVARPQDAVFPADERTYLLQLGELLVLGHEQEHLRIDLAQTYADLQHSQQVSAQQERLRALGQIAGGVAHDINNAISPVSLVAESMLEREAALSERGRQQLQTIQRALDDVAATVRRMRELSRPPGDDARPAWLNANTVVQAVIEATRPRWRDLAQRSGVHIALDTELAQPAPMARLYEADVRDTLTNLILNATDALPAGGRLVLRTRVVAGAGTGGDLVIEVQDDGTGMDEATRLRCFEPFFSTKGERGSGLGLSIVHAAMQRHGGRAEVISTPGKGTTVRLTYTGAVSGGEAGDTFEADLPSVTRTLRLLLVDDEALLRASLGAILQLEGHDVDTADCGEAGLAAVRRAVQAGQGYDVVVTDLGMPGMDGTALARSVKEVAPGTPVVVLTGWGEPAQGEDTGVPVDAWLSKPPRLAEIRRVLSQWQLRHPG